MDGNTLQKLTKDRINITLSIELFSDIIEECKEIISVHVDELEDSKQFDPDMDQYLSMQQLGILKSIVMRDNGKIVGYCLVFVGPNHRCKTEVTGTVDVLYVLKNYRRFDISRRFFKFIEKVLKNNNVTNIRVASRKSVDTSKFLEYLGYHYIEAIYGKDI